MREQLWKTGTWEAVCVHKGRSLEQAALCQLVESMATIALSGFVAPITSPSTVGSFGGHMNFREGSFEKN